MPSQEGTQRAAQSLLKGARAREQGGSSVPGRSDLGHGGQCPDALPSSTFTWSNSGRLPCSVSRKPGREVVMAREGRRKGQSPSSHLCPKAEAPCRQERLPQPSWTSHSAAQGPRCPRRLQVRSPTTSSSHWSQSGSWGAVKSRRRCKWCGAHRRPSAR